MTLSWIKSTLFESAAM